MRPTFAQEVISVDVTSAWYWEGNVVDAVERHLLWDGWNIVSKADSLSKARGVDLIAPKPGRSLLVEVKGYPASTYRDPLRAVEPKRTPPASQAQQWYSHAILKGMRLQHAYPDAEIALAFPDFPRYRTLYDQTRGGLGKLGPTIMFVTESGNVDRSGP